MTRINEVEQTFDEHGNPVAYRAHYVTKCNRLCSIWEINVDGVVLQSEERGSIEDSFRDEYAWQHGKAYVPRFC